MKNLLKNYDYLSLEIIVIFILVFIIILELIEPKFFLWDDNSDYFLPCYNVAYNSVIKHKTIPLINFHQYLGYTFLAQGQPAVLYPPMYLAFFISEMIFREKFFTIDIIVMMHFLIAGIGMFYLLRAIRNNHAVSIIGSLIWVTFPFVIFVTKNWVGISYLAAYLPLNFLFLNKLLTRCKFKHALILSVIKALFFYSGFIQFFLYMIFYEVLFIILFLIFYFQNLNSSTEKRAKIFSFCSLYIFSYISLFFLTAPLLLPVLNAQKESALRVDKLNLQVFLVKNMYFKDFIMAQFFLFKKEVINLSGSQIFFAGSVFFINIFISLYFIFLKKKFSFRRIIPYFLMSIIALIFSTKLNIILYYFPILHKFRMPFKNFIFCLFFLTMTNSILFSWLSIRIRILSKKTVLILLSSVLLSNIFLVLKYNDTKFGPFRITSDEQINSQCKLLINPNKGRMLTYLTKNVTVEGFYPRYLNFNFASLSGLYAFGGYDPLISKLNHNLCLKLNHENYYKGNFDQNLLDYLSYWGVRYIITNDNQFNRDLFDKFNKVDLLYEGDEVLLYENTEAAPIVSTIQQTIQIDENFFSNFAKIEKTPVDFEYSVNQIKIFPNNNSPQTVYINIAPLPNYFYFIDGVKKGKIEPKKIPLSITIPQNTKLLTIKYVDHYFIIGVILFFIWLIIIVIIHVVIFSKKTPEHVN